MGEFAGDYSKQAKEIAQLEAVKNQLNQLQSKIQSNHQQPAAFTQIMNPHVQNNLNTLIKSQRDEIIRLSSSVGLRPEPQRDEEERVPAFDQSL